MKRRHLAEYRHTAALSLGEDGDAARWEGDVTLSYRVHWGFAGSRDEPAEGATVTDWRITHVDRQPVGPDGAPKDMEALVEAKLAEIEPDMLEAAAEDDAYHAEQAAEGRREAMRESRW